MATNPFTGIEVCYIGGEIRSYDVYLNGVTRRGGCSADGHVVDPCPMCENARESSNNRVVPSPCNAIGPACRIERIRMPCPILLANTLADGIVAVLENQDENG